MWCFIFYALTSQKPQFLNLFAVDFAGFHRIDPGGIYAAVAEDVGEAHDVPLYGVIGARKEMAKVVGKHLPFGHVRYLA